jgi:predicted component of type VI protein secretion system
MKNMESEIGFLVSRMEEGRKTNREEMKATIKSIWSEVDETIQQQVGNIMTRPRDTESADSLARDNYLARSDGGIL